MDHRTTLDVDGSDAAGLLQEVVRRAERGDRSALPELRRLLDREPAIWRHAGDLGKIAEASTIELTAGHDLLLAESLARSVGELKSELAGPDPSRLDRLLAHRVASAGCSRRTPTPATPRPGAARPRPSSTPAGGRIPPRDASARRSSSWPPSAGCSATGGARIAGTAATAGEPGCGYDSGGSVVTARRFTIHDRRNP
jgi:hypothetical protein